MTSKEFEQLPRAEQIRLFEEAKKRPALTHGTAKA